MVSSWVKASCRYESWFDTRTLASLRYVQDIREGNYERHSVFDMIPRLAVAIELSSYSWFRSRPVYTT